MGDGHTYQGGETTGFQSPAQDHITKVVDLADVLDLRRPSRYAVRVGGRGLPKRGIEAGDILITDRAVTPSSGRIAIAFVQGDIVLAQLLQRAGQWFLIPDAAPSPIQVSADAEIWGIVLSLVREEV
ncbi:LexA family protein [Caballeronia sp. GaOx3]|uniref:LexA family protein n=1 Tax=Caballeronia sp. GaOx3 TaxID=2921740 RepID=UPI002027BF47|nr:S24 family peptidase [Caballeronia sp. GaOx3]